MERQRALGIDQGTPTTEWDGTPMDTDWALGCLYPQEPRPREGEPDDDVSAETPPGSGDSGATPGEERPPPR